MRATFMASTRDCECQFRTLTVPPQGHYSSYQVVVVLRREQRCRNLRRSEGRCVRAHGLGLLFNQSRDRVEAVCNKFNRLTEITGPVGNGADTLCAQPDRAERLAAQCHRTSRA